MVIQVPKGTKDILPGEIFKWQYIEKIIYDICKTFNFQQIRTPVFEYTELYQRGVGDSTDIVQKEMYTFTDKGGRSITLRPEGTAGVVRSFIENGMSSLPMPVKLFYFITCYRYEKSQKGRYREHNQFGIEMFGASGYKADAEVISLAAAIFAKLEILDKLKLSINSIGCPNCRPEFMRNFKEFMELKKDQLCETCQDRLEKNPMRILDCKSPVCNSLTKGAPIMIDYLCEDCDEHFEGLKNLLKSNGLDFSIDTGIVRGQDYYSKTVFEFVFEEWKTQNVICGGGRYDGLVEICGGSPTPATGFGMGIERMIMCMEDCKVDFPPAPQIDIYIAGINQESESKIIEIVSGLRKAEKSAEYDFVDRSLKNQMRFANKIGARYTTVIGEDELEKGTCSLKDMSSGEVNEIKIDEIAQYC
jgi:histidyl-tRNA synthetase